MPREMPENHFVIMEDDVRFELTRQVIKSMTLKEAIEFLAGVATQNAILRYDGPIDFIKKCLKSGKAVKIPFDPTFVHLVNRLCKMRGDEPQIAGAVMVQIFMEGIQAIASQMVEAESSYGKLSRKVGQRLEKFMNLEESGNDPDIPSDQD